MPSHFILPRRLLFHLKWSVISKYCWFTALQQMHLLNQAEVEYVTAHIEVATPK